MIYILIKNIIETTIQNYRCELCTSTLNEVSISLQKLSDTSIDLECTCPSCKTISHVHIQVADMKQAMMNANTKIINKNAIKSEDILKISEDIAHAHTIEDLLR